MAKFRVDYEEVQPGWDEFMKSGEGCIVIEAKSAESAKLIFDANKDFRHCFVYKVTEIKNG